MIIIIMVVCRIILKFYNTFFLKNVQEQQFFVA